MVIKQNNLLKSITIGYIIIVILTITLKITFKLSIIGNYTNVVFILIGLYIFILHQIIGKGWNTKIANSIFIGISVIVIVSQLLFLSKSELYFSSPNNTNTIIVVERSTLKDGYSSIYQRKYLIFKKPINWNRIDGLNNFSSGFYTIEWISEKAAIMKRNGEHYGQVNLD